MVWLATDVVKVHSGILLHTWATCAAGGAGRARGALELTHLILVPRGGGRARGALGLIHLILKLYLSLSRMCYEYDHVL